MHSQPFTFEWENTVAQRYIYNYTSVFHNICLKGLYMHKRLHEI